MNKVLTRVQLDRTNTKVTMQIFMVSKFPLEFGTLFANISLGNSKSKYHLQWCSVVTAMSLSCSVSEILPPLQFTVYVNVTAFDLEKSFL